MLKRGDKQFRRSLKTKDRKLADRRLAELRSQVGSLRITDETNHTFDQIAARWMAATQHTLKQSSITRRLTCLKNLSPYFRGITIRNIQSQHCERWVVDRAAKIAPQTMAHELNAMRAVFEYAVTRFDASPTNLITRSLSPAWRTRETSKYFANVSLLMKARTSTASLKGGVGSSWRRKDGPERK